MHKVINDTAKILHKNDCLISYGKVAYQLVIENKFCNHRTWTNDKSNLCASNMFGLSLP